jgi:hypothetical protein
MKKLQHNNFYFFIIFAFLDVFYGFPLSETSIKVIPLSLDENCPRIQWTNLTSGTLYSPNFPQHYPNNANCTYLITCPIGTTVTVVFELVSLDSCCDHIFLYEGPGLNDTNRLAKITGSSTTFKYKTIHSNIMTVQFISDENIVDQGFYAVFSINDNLTECTSVTYSNPFGVTVSPDFPSNYPPNSICNHLIGTGEEGSTVILTINKFVTEYCCDFLKIYDDSNSLEKEPKTLHGNITSETKYYSTGPYMFLSFSSDSNTQSEGFSITYQIISANPFNSVTTSNSIHRRLDHKI